MYGIQQQFTIPYNPQQNGRIERFNGTIINSAKVLLNDAKLSRQFWEDAVATANYIHNRIPHHGIKNKIPFELLNNSKVDYSNLRIFGCKVLFYVPKSFRSKFDNNASPGIFLGYNDYPAAFKILDLNNNKIILSGSVVYLETTPGNSYLDQCSPQISNYVPNNEIREDNSYFKYNSYNPSNPQYNDHNIINNFSFNNNYNNIYI